MTPLYNHTSQDTAYLVTDYPYGRLRTLCRFWLEYKASKGVRMMMQTQNPKNGVWNKPHGSTYMLLAGNLFLDEKEHCHWRGLSQYSSAQDFLSFLQDFPENKDKDQLLNIKVFVAGRLGITRAKAMGKAVISINRVPQLPGPAEQEEAKKELAIYEECLSILKNRS